MDKAALLETRRPVRVTLIAIIFILTVLSVAACVTSLVSAQQAEVLNPPQLEVAQITECELAMAPCTSTPVPQPPSPVARSPLASHPPPPSSVHTPEQVRSPPTVQRPMTHPPPPLTPSPSLSPPSSSSPSPSPSSPSAPPVCVVVDDEDGLPQFETNARRAVPGQKPYFEGWHGETASKSFVHDAHSDKGLRIATYQPVLPSAGCYAVQEWHPTGGYVGCLTA